MKPNKILAIILSVLILALSGCNADTGNLRQEDNSEQETIIITEREHITTVPVITSEPAETTVPAAAAETVTETVTNAPAQTTVTEAAKPAETTPRPAETTAATTQKPAETAAPKPAETTAAETDAPSQTTTEAAIQPLNGSVLNDYSQKWFYNQISDKQKIAYERLYNAISEQRKKIDVSDLDMDLEDLKAVCFSYEKDNPGFITTYWEYSAEYYGTESNADVQTIVAVYDPSADGARLKAAADSVLAEAKKLPDDYRRLKYVHDWISENTVYNDSGKYHTKRADGPLLHGEAICSGYSKALMYFAQELGIPCLCIEGYTKEEHMWNMVKLDGSWYHVDMTYDDPITSSGANALRYDYFLVSDSTIRKDHTISKQIAIPSAPEDYLLP